VSATRLVGPVRIVGTGLIGTSIGLGLRARGIEVILDDASAANVRLAADYGAGRLAQPGDEPTLIVVSVPPDAVADVVAAELESYPKALVTDVASVKLAPLQSLRDRGADISRYLGSHPLAGRERGGPSAGRADLFVGRPWVVAGHDAIGYREGAAVEDLIMDLGALPIEMDAAEHDEAVALISHVPQLVSSLTAARLVDAQDAAVGLAGGGLRDVTRVAASDPSLWQQILGANAEPVVRILQALRDDLDGLIAALTDLDAPGARRTVAEVLTAGNAGVARIPGKHGSTSRFTTVTVLIDDRPGQLAALLTEIGELGVNLEDLRLEHSPGAELGIVEVAVLPAVAAGLRDALTERGWRIAG